MGSLKWAFTKVLGDINGFIEASVCLRRYLLGRSKKALSLGHGDWPCLQGEPQRPLGVARDQDHRGTCRPWG